MDFSNYKLERRELKGLNSFKTRSSTPLWNRLELSPRGSDMKDALKAKISDPLWMLTRQWQMGEFVGDDAGTAVFTNLSYDNTQLNIDTGFPLEPIVERQPVFTADANYSINLTIRVQMANYWIKLLKIANESLVKSFVDKKEYAFKLLTSFEESIEEAQYISLLQGRSFDGYKFFMDDNKFSGFHSTENESLQKLYEQFETWYKRMYTQPENEDDNKWQSANLEYKFDVNIDLKKPAGSDYNRFNLGSNEYYQGHLDWYNFDGLQFEKINSDKVDTKKTTHKQYPTDDNKNLIPAPVSFNGMPAPRYWAFEDGATNFAAIKTDKLDVGKLAIIEFGLIFSNDWSIIPIKIPVGTMLNINSLEIVDSFGIKTAIPSKGTTSENHWNQWKFFGLDKAQTIGSSELNGLLLAPTIVKAQQSKPLEEVNFIRDEVANLIWAVETVINNPFGIGIPGREISVLPSKKEEGKLLKYIEKTTVPKNWIPFIVIPPDKNNPKKLKLRRGSMIDDKDERIRPKTSILRKGLNKDNEQDSPFDIAENEIGREGIKVIKTYQRTRWTNGETIVWVGLQKKTGKGEGSSLLAFDQLKYNKV